MSDDEDYDYDYGGNFESDDDLREDIADHVDSLAEHTLHSPVLVNAQPDFELEYDEWEYLTDEYWDGESGSATKTTAPNQTKLKAQEKRKRGDKETITTDGQSQKCFKTSSSREASQRGPLVVWKSKSKENGLSVPVIKPDDGNEVALLRNWRELLDESPDTTRRSSPGRSEQEKLKKKASNTSISTKKKTTTRQSKRKRGEKADDSVKEDLDEKRGHKEPAKATRTSKRLKK